VPFSVNSSLAFRPDLADAGPLAQQQSAAAPTAAERQEFASALDAAARVSTTERTSSPALVRPARTRLSGDEAASALGLAWQRARGQAPTPGTLSILVGQWAHETGRGASMLNYNFGGIKGTGPSGLSTVYGTHEGSGAETVHIQDRFRAYGSAEEGAGDYLDLLVRRYPDAVHAAEREDPVGFVKALKARGYFTGDENDYIKSVSALADQALNAGFDALGLASSAARGVAAPSRSSTDSGGMAFAPEAPFGPAERRPPPGALQPAPAWTQGSFADEVNRAALLMSALRIGQTSERRG
jgi:flagellum-specific peptidoglycan hydrolase FlgJ